MQTTKLVRGTVEWEDTYHEAFPNGIPCVYDPEGAKYGTPAPRFDYETARQVTAILSDPSFYWYAWVPGFVPTLIEYDAQNEEVRAISPDDDGLYELCPGLLWDATPASRVGLVRFRFDHS